MYRWFLLALGIAVGIFGLVADEFYPGGPGIRRPSRKPVPRWFGRLWFLGLAAALIYWGVMARAN